MEATAKASHGVTSRVLPRGQDEPAQKVLHEVFPPQNPYRELYGLLALNTY